MQKKRINKQIGENRCVSMYRCRDNRHLPCQNGWRLRPAACRRATYSCKVTCTRDIGGTAMVVGRGAVMPPERHHWEMRDDEKTVHVLHPAPPPPSTTYLLARIAQGETILPHLSTLGQGKRWPRCPNVETSGRS